jgi:hypothetical protein
MLSSGLRPLYFAVQIPAISLSKQLIKDFDGKQRQHGVVAIWIGELLVYERKQSGHDRVISTVLV